MHTYRMGHIQNTNCQGRKVRPEHKLELDNKVFQWKGSKIHFDWTVKSSTNMSTKNFSIKIVQIP